MLFIDGTMVTRKKFTQWIDANKVLIGATYKNLYPMKGGIQDLIVYNDIAKYTENFVPQKRSMLASERNYTGISGARTNYLSITSSDTGSDRIDCVLSNPNESITDVITNPVNLIITESRSILRVEAYDGTSEADLYSYNLDDEEFSINSDSINSDEICLYTSEKDVEIEMDLYGAKGVDFDVWAVNTNWSSGDPGGEGGYSRITFEMKKNEEYILKGIKSNSALFLYRKASLIAVVGQGGYGGHYGPGGKGGGVNVAGGGGAGRFHGDGGLRIGIGELTENGTFGGRSNIASVYPGDSIAPSTSDGGQTIKCSKGIYWRDQGKGSCEDLGTIQYRTKDGTVVTNSALIDRGFKAGYAINTTGGSRGDSDGGNGGNGATGGGGATGNDGGGGGGSGYTSGLVTINDTKLGGNKSNASFVVFSIPSASTITEWRVTRSAAYTNRIYFSRQSGQGPDSISFGPNSATVFIEISKGAHYMLSRITVNGGTFRTDQLRLSNNVGPMGGYRTLGLEDIDGGGDNDYNDLMITCNQGKFINTHNWYYT